MLDVTTTSSATTITSKVPVGRQFGAVGLCAVLVAVAFMQPVEQRFVCRDDDRCELTTRRLVGREVIHIGSASRVSSVKVPRKTRTTSRSRRHRTLLELTAPAESIAVERRIGTEIRTWLTQGTVVDGVRLPPRATPFHAEDSTSGVIFVVLFVCAAGALAFGARQFVQVELEKRGMQVRVRTRRLWRTKESVFSLASARITARAWDLEQLPAGLWGVWAETRPGAGLWVAVAISEGEAEHVVELLQESARRG